jgi:hypothetical protein
MVPAVIHVLRVATSLVGIVLGIWVLLAGIVAAEAQTRPSSTAQSPSDRVIEHRAVEAVIWGMPAVNFDLLYQGMVQAKGAWNQIVYWSRLPDWKNQTLTPNPDTIYFFPFFNTKDVGPMVLEIPPADEGSITGSVDDAWQTALEDVGPAGVDQGRGGKYLILPPGYKDPVPAGYIALPSDTYAGYAVLRSNLRSGSDADIAKAVAYGMRVKLYPLAGGQPAADDIRRCDRRHVRQHHPLRSALLPVTRPLRAERALAGKG